MYDKLNNLQTKYLTTMRESYLTASDNALRMLLGLPKLSIFLSKLKLALYEDIFKKK